MPAGDRWQAVVYAAHYTSVYEFWCHFLDTGSITHTESTVLNAIWVDWRKYINFCTQPALITNRIKVRRLNGLTPWYEEAKAPVGGTKFGPPMPHQVNWVMTLRTATPGRRGRGRVYMPAMKGEWVTHDGRLHEWFYGDILPNVTAWFNDWCSPAGSSGLRWCLFSRADNVYRPITRLDIQPIPRTQRRRNVGVGI